MSWFLTLCLAWTLRCVNGNFRLPSDVTPIHYELKLLYDVDPFTNFSFFGVVNILLKTANPTSRVVVHAHTKNFVVAKEKVKLVMVRPGIIGERLNEGIAVENIALDNNTNFLTINFKKSLLLSEAYSLSIPFYGHLKTDSGGVYSLNYVDKKTKAKQFAITSSFEPSSAREAFPCFDEPLYKATYVVSIGHNKDYHALFNMPLEITRNDNAFGEVWSWEVIEKKFGKSRDDLVWDRFVTTPVMSTYLLGFVISKFQRVECKPSPSKTNISVWARPDMIPKISYVASVVTDILVFYEDYFNLTYALPKLDHVFLPASESKAFESWGLIIYYQEMLLYDANEYPEIRSIAINVISHEVSHQWFGNLVTMKWWNELWLKEGFATALSCMDFGMFLPKEEYNCDLNFVEDIYNLLSGNVLESDYPVSAPMDATNASHATNLFNSFAYQKAAVIIRMLHLTLGEEVFKEAVHNYLVKFSYKNAESHDLWEQFHEASLKREVLPRNVTLEHVMDEWTTQIGYPLLTVKRDYETNSLNITQERYRSAVDIHMGNISSQQTSSASWWIPLAVLSEKDDQQAPLAIQWLADYEGTTAPHRYGHGSNMNEWLLFNDKMLALCRVNYDEHNWRLLSSTLTRGDYKSIPIMSRAQLLSDSFELAWTGRLDYSLSLELASYLSREENSKVMSIGLHQFKNIENLLIRSPEYEIYQHYMRGILAEPYERVGGLGGNNKMQALISEWACRMDVSGCEEAALTLFQEWMDTNKPEENNPIPIYIRGFVYCMGVARGGSKNWRFMEDLTHSSNDAIVSAALGALCCSKEPWLLHRYLDLAVSKSSGIDELDGHLIFVSTITSPVGFYVAKDFIYRRTDDYISRLNRPYFRQLPILVNQFTAQEELDEFLIWREINAKSLESSDLALNRAVEQARIRLYWLARSRQLLVYSLKKFTAGRQGSPKVDLKTSNKANKILSASVLSVLMFLKFCLANYNYDNMKLYI